jgi:hypothetical protein
LKIFTILIIAQKVNANTIDFSTSCCKALSEAEAIGLGYKRAFEDFPIEKDFFDHRVSVLEVPEDWYELKK